MTVRDWLASDRKYLKKIRQIGSELIATKALEKAPIWSRLWNAYIHWALRVCSYELRSAAQFARTSFLIRYCRTADRVFGGTRYAQFQERQRRLAECCQQKADELKKQLEEREGKNFAREIVYQALTNPNFVVNDHIDQDR